MPATILICGSPADRFEIVALTLKAWEVVRFALAESRLE